jgi:uncharacterized RDD family membrane protein YckC
VSSDTLSTGTDPSGYPRAGLLRRMAALLYDAFLVAAIWMSLGFVLQMIFGTDTSRLADGRVVVDPLYRVLVFAMMVGSAATFYIWFWRRTGQTLGMIAWRIKVLSHNNTQISLKQGLIRFFAAWPAFWIAGAGYLWLYIDKDGDALHEKLSRSKTVLLPKGSRPF